ncbi:MAG: hypothetical protein ACTSWN_02445 [Promethearchaeota archaeon]
MNGINVFLKISGLIIEKPTILDELIEDLVETSHDHDGLKFKVVIGGGKKVDKLREIYKNKPGEIQKLWMEKHHKRVCLDCAAHWLAIECIDENGAVIEKRYKDVQCLEIINVSKTLKQLNADLPESWDVTSDSIIYWIANRMSTNDNRFFIILLKEVTGILEIQECKHTSIPHRRSPVTGNLVQELKIVNGYPIPELISYPFDEFLFKLIDRYKSPIYIASYLKTGVIKRILNGERDSRYLYSVVMDGCQQNQEDKA